MAVTAEAAFKVVDQASNPIAKITTSATKGQNALDKMGKALDAVDGPAVTKSLKTTQTNVDAVGKTTEKTATKVKVNTEQMGKSFEHMSSKGQREIAKLMATLKAFEKERATAQLDVDVAMAEAKIRLIKQEIRTFSTMQARKELDMMGVSAKRLTADLVGGSAGGGGGPPNLVGAGGAGGGGLRRGFFAAAGGVTFFAAAAAAALPAILALSGAASALIGSLGAASLGAGALAVGGGGALVVGIAAIASTAIPAAKGLKEVKDAQDDYNQAIQQYGRASAQAAQAQRALNQARRQNPGAGGVLNNAQVLGQRWTAATRPGRRDTYGIMNRALRGVDTNLDSFAATTNLVLSSSRAAVDRFFDAFERPEVRRIIETLGQTFARSIGPFADGLADVGLILGRIAVAASPRVIELFDRFSLWTDKMVGKTAATSALERSIGGMTDQLSSWVRLFSSAIKLAAAFFGTGAAQGQSMVDSMTATLDKWTDWVQDNPAKIQAFFDRTIDSTGKLAEALAQVALTFGKIADKLLPVLNMVSDLTSMLGNETLAPLFALMAIGAGVNKVRGMSAGVGGIGAWMMGGRGALAGRGGGMGAAGAAVAGGAAGGARGGIGGLRGAFGAYRMGRAYGQSGASAASGVLRGAGGMALRGAAKFAAPLAIGMGALDFITTPGTFGERAQATLSGATFGLINRPELGTESRARGQEAAAAVVPRGVDAMRSRVNTLRTNLAATNTQTHVTRGGTVVTVDPVLSGDARERAQAQLDALRPVLRATVQLRQEKAAGRAFDDLTRAFEIRWRKLGSDAAGKSFTQGLSRQLKQLKPQGDRELLRATASWTQVLENGSKKQKEQAERLRQAIVREFKEMGKTVRIVNGNIYDISKTKWKDIRQLIGGEAERALQETSRSFTAMQRVAVDALKTMGFSGADARNIVRGLEKGGQAGRVARHDVQSGPTGAGQSSSTNSRNMAAGHARGGRLGGIGTFDSVALGNGEKAAPGELVVNRHTERKIDRRLGFPGAMAMLVNGEHVPHNMNATSFARGGRVGGGNITTATRDVINRFPGLVVTSTTGGTHAAGSYHYRGMAADIGGPSAVMNAAAAYIRRVYGRSLAEGIHNPNLSIKNGQDVPPSFWGADTWAGHANHIHMAIAGAVGQFLGLSGGGGPGSAPQISARQLLRRMPGQSTRGAPGAMVTAARRAMATGMARKINQRTGAGGAGMPWDGTIGGTPKQWLIEALKITGHYTPENLRLLYGRMMQESGGNPNAINNWDSNAAAGIPSQGLLQTIPPTFQTYRDPSLPNNIRHPVANAVAAINYMFARYGHIVGPSNSGYALGGRIGGSVRAPQWGGWHQRGGSFTVHRPTLIGVGEGGKETVSVTRPGDKGNGGGGDIIFKVNIGEIKYNGDGDIAEVLEKEFKAAVRGLNGNDEEDELG